jgi:hypothetical protein
VDQREAEKVLYAASNGELAFGLLTEGSVVGPAAAMTVNELFE